MDLLKQGENFWHWNQLYALTGLVLLLRSIWTLSTFNSFLWKIYLCSFFFHNVYNSRLSISWDSLLTCGYSFSDFLEVRATTNWIGCAVLVLVLLKSIYEQIWNWIWCVVYRSGKNKMVSNIYLCGCVSYCFLSFHECNAQILFWDCSSQCT